jgi:hypothetical protein
MDRWEALVRYAPEISEAATKLLPFGPIWIARLGAAFFALNEDRSYPPNIVSELQKEAAFVVIEAERLATREFLQAFSKTQDGQNTTEEAIDILIQVREAGGRFEKETDGTIAAHLDRRGTSFLRSSAEIVRFGRFALKELASKT